jgi:signal transduction histidine kinase/ActR/RegA family two-component response regulator
MPNFSRLISFSHAEATLNLKIRGQLVNTLYASMTSLAAGAVAGGVIAVAIARAAHSLPITICAGFTVLIGAARVAFSLVYRILASRGPMSIESWERGYEVGAACYAGVLGLLGFFALHSSANATVHLLAATTVIGYAAGIAGRNAGRPSIAIMQLSFAALPVSIGLFAVGDGLYTALGLVTLVFIVGMIDITLQTYDAIMKAFVHADENAALAVALKQTAAEAMAASEAKTRFLANMSHEIRTPLNGVLGMTEAILSDTLSPLQRERLGIVRQSGETLLAILNDILDLSKVEAGKLELEAKPFRLADLAASADVMFKEAARHKGLAFSVVAAGATDAVFNGDAGRIRQILFNLISNALKFTDGGGVYVVLTETDDRLSMTVRDTGPGIEPDHLERLFERFQQADASTTRKFGGTGLGLAICWELTQLLGGEISAQSTLGQGATFQVDLPLRRAEAADALAFLKADLQQARAGPTPPAPPAQSPPTPAETPKATTRLLCAEDNEINQLVLRALLEPLNYDVVMVENGLKALEAWRAESFDLLILDVQMPVMDGPTAAAAIRAREREMGLAPIPIMALTANVMSSQVQDYLSIGMNCVVAKPINLDELYAAIDKLLKTGAPASASTLAAVA